MANRSSSFFITGIPRSGTSLLCAMLDRHPGIAVINEPREVFDALRPEPSVSLGDLLRDWRGRIEKGLPIQNQVDEAGLVTDTHRAPGPAPHVSRVEGDEFLIGVKNTLVFLSSLRTLREAFPEAVIVRMIRHPQQTLHSWSQTFPHLRKAVLPDVARHAFYKQAACAGQLRQIEAMHDLAARRAALWSFLAAAELPDDPNFLTVRYEDLVSNTATQIRRILSSLGLEMPSGLLRDFPLESRPQHQPAASEVECVQRICADEMSRFDYAA